MDIPRERRIIFKAQSDTFHRFLNFIALIIAVTNICGCNWHVNHLYDGQERPLEEVAILLVEEPVFLARVDDIKAYIPCFLLCADKQECHIPPGTHSITAYYLIKPSYSEPGSMSYGLLGEEVTIEWYLQPGVVYRLKPLRFAPSKVELPAPGRPAGSWNFDVVRVGPVSETFCSPIPGLTIPPPYWVEYAKIHCPGKSPYLFP